MGGSKVVPIGGELRLGLLKGARHGWAHMVRATHWIPRRPWREMGGWDGGTL